MPLWGSRMFQAPPDKVAISAEVNHIVANTSTPVEIEVEDGRYVVLEAEVGEWRVRPGRHISRDFDNGDVSIADDEITVIDHGYETGDGPLQLVEVAGAYVDTGAETLTFADADPDTITRSAGSFVTDGFTAGMTLQVAGTTNNDLTLTIAAGGVAALVLTLIASDELIAEGLAGAGVTITGSSLPRGLSSGVDYWIIVVDGDTFQLADTRSDAMRIKQTGADSAEESDAIPVDLVTAGSADTSSVGGTASMVEVAVDGADDGGVLLTGPTAADPGRDRMVFTGKVVTVLAFGGTDALAWWHG